jgi:hypothetical protein
MLRTILTSLLVLVVTSTGLQTTGQDGQPRVGSAPVLRRVELAFPTQGDGPLRSPEGYLRMMSVTSTNGLFDGPTWTFYARVEPMIIDDADRLWRSGQFHSLWVEVVDVPFENSVVGKRVIFNVVERVLPGDPPKGLPEPPPGYETPPPSHERVYPPR